MRQADADEVMAQSGHTPAESLLKGFMCSDPCLAIVNRNGTVIGMWGVVPQTDKVGRIWMLGTNAMFDDFIDKRTFLHEAVNYVEELHKRYTVLFNEIDARNKVHMKWLRWMGFTFVRYRPNYGVEGRPFYEFCRVSHV